MQIHVEDDKRWLNDRVELWRYVPLRTLFFHLSGLIFVPSIAKLRAIDPFEGEFHEDIAWYNHAFSQYYAQQASDIEGWMQRSLCTKEEQHHIKENRHHANAAAQILRRRYFDFIWRTRFAWCWFQSPHESAMMWRLYGNQGVAIKSTVGRITALFDKTGRDFIFGKMTYVDYLSGAGPDFMLERDYKLLLRPFFLKRMEYNSENEVRFVTAGPALPEGDGILLEGLKAEDWISAIRLWPGLTEDEDQSLSKAIKQFLPQVDCIKSDLFSRPAIPQGFLGDFRAELRQSVDLNWTSGGDEIPRAIKIP